VIAPPGAGGACWAKDGMLWQNELQIKKKIMALVQIFQKLLFFFRTIYLHKNGH